MPDQRTVVDTNVLLSAACFLNSASRQAVSLANRSGIFLVSGAVLEEYWDVLNRKKFDRYVSLETRLIFLRALLLQSDPVKVSETVTICRDPKDNKFLEAALNGSADFILSGDADLLTLHPFRGIPILTPRQFLNVFSQ